MFEDKKIVQEVRRGGSIPETDGRRLYLSIDSEIGPHNRCVRKLIWIKPLTGGGEGHALAVYLSPGKPETPTYRCLRIVHRPFENGAEKTCEWYEIRPDGTVAHKHGGKCEYDDGYPKPESTLDGGLDRVTQKGITQTIKNSDAGTIKILLKLLNQ